MAKVVVTGAAGFIGHHLVKALVDRGDEVTCLVRKASRLDRLTSLGIAMAFGDVNDFGSLRDPLAGQDVVFHLAACIRAIRAREYYRVNVEGTRNVAWACAEQQRPPVLVISSSLAAVGPSPNGRLLTDHDPPRPVSEYGRSKREAELVAMLCADRVPTTIVRVAGVFGEGDLGCVPLFRPIARWAVHLSPVWPRLGVSMIHVADLAHLLILAAERGKRIDPAEKHGDGINQGYYLAAADEHPTYAELGRMYGRACGRSRVLVVPLPAALFWPAAWANEVVARLRGRPTLLNIDKVREISRGSWLCQPSAAPAELGFSVSASLVDRMRQTVEWYRDGRSGFPA